MVTDLDQYKYSIVWYIRINNENYLIFMKTQMYFFIWAFYWNQYWNQIQLKCSIFSMLKGIAFVKMYTLKFIDP